MPKDNVRKVAQGKDGNKGDVYDGTCPGAIKLLDAEHHYRPEHVPFALTLSLLLIPAFPQARRGA